MTERITKSMAKNIYYGGAMKGVMAGQVKGLNDAQIEAIAQ